MAYSREELDYIFESTDGRCHICWRLLSRRSYGRTWETDHSVARVNGGTNYLRNLKPACISCNRFKRKISSRAARRQFNHKRAPQSKTRREQGRLFGVLLGGTFGLFFGPMGAALGAGAGYALGGQDDDF